MKYSRLTGGVVAAAVAVAISGYGPSANATVPRSVTVTHVTEHYKGNVYSLTPTNWHGAKDCAIVSPSEAYCFDTSDEMAAFKPPAVAHADVASSPDSGASCNGAFKIWNGTNWTGQGLAFYNYGYNQSLAPYATLPFQVKSWFSNGQRSYSKVTNCIASLNANENGSGSSLLLEANSASTSMGPFATKSIYLTYCGGTCH